MKLLITSQAMQVVKSSRLYRTGTRFVSLRSNIQSFSFVKNPERTLCAF